MSLFDDFVHYEFCFPGAVTDSTKINGPHYNELLTVRVNDPMGEGQGRYDAR